MEYEKNGFYVDLISIKINTQQSKHKTKYGVCGCARVKASDGFYVDLISIKINTQQSKHKTKYGVCGCGCARVKASACAVSVQVLLFSILEDRLLDLHTPFHLKKDRAKKSVQDLQESIQQRPVKIKYIALYGEDFSQDVKIDTNQKKQTQDAFKMVGVQ